MIRRLFETIYKLINRYDFRTVMVACFTFVVSVGFAAFNAVVSAITYSFWYGALSAYYALLAITRFGIIFHHLKTRKLSEETEEQKRRREAKTYRACGIILIFLAFALGAAVLQMALSNRTFVNTPGSTIYLVAIYTFYKIISAVFHLVRAQKDDDITIQAVRNVNFADALVSMLALQTAMIHEFLPETNLWQMNALTGTLVCLATITIGILMVILGHRKRRRLSSTATYTEGTVTPAEMGVNTQTNVKE